MARASRLKLFRTPMGFFDAVIAAPSRAAALKAWGVTSNLFADKLAEEVTDDADLLAEASKTPGEVLRKPRGDAAAVLAAPSPPKRSKPAKSSKAELAAAPQPPAKAKPASKPKPMDRSKLDAAETALTRAKERLADQLLALDDEREELDAREAAMRRDGKANIEEAERLAEREREAFDRS